MRGALIVLGILLATGHGPAAAGGPYDRAFSSHEAHPDLTGMGDAEASAAADAATGLMSLEVSVSDALPAGLPPLVTANIGEIGTDVVQAGSSEAAAHAGFNHTLKALPAGTYDVRANLTDIYAATMVRPPEPSLPLFTQAYGATTGFLFVLVSRAGCPGDDCYGADGDYIHAASGGSAAFSANVTVPAGPALDVYVLFSIATYARVAGNASVSTSVRATLDSVTSNLTS